ncbi:MAG: urease accessory protein UreD [Luteolibacter sp.]
MQPITFRLADSVPNQLVKEWGKELELRLDSTDSSVSRKAEAELHQRISQYEDAGNGSCLLSNPAHAEVVQKALIKGHGVEYNLIEWCIMPNHVHVLIGMNGEAALGEILKRWKGGSAVLINGLEGRTGAVWMADYHDRFVRDMDHLNNAKAYIRNNPVKAGLCVKAEDWRFSSAGSNWSAEFIPPASSATGGINSALPVSGTSLSGHLHLRCECRADGVPMISEQSFRAPIHLSKSHVDHGQLVLSIVNPTAGFFDGDRLESDVHVAPRAKLVLSTPSASRVYRTRSGKAAVSFQKFRVEADASLEWIPEPFIPHAGARYAQQTEITLHPTASLLFFDWIAPGRVAMGEVFAYQELRWELDLTLDETLIARERYSLRPDDESLEALKAKFPAAHYLSVYAAGDMAENWPGEALDALNSDDVYLGHGPLTGGVHVIRALCRDSLAARKLIETLRPLLYSSADLTPPNLGRIFW